MPNVVTAPALLTVVVPIFNEKETLTGLLANLIPHCRQNGWQMILVDDGSTDGTGFLLDQMIPDPSIQIFHHKVNRGYGGALKTGIGAVNTSYLVTIDADGQHSIKDIDVLFNAMQETKADLLIGNRGGHNANEFRAVGKWLIRTFAGFLMTIPISDLNSGFKLYRTDLAQQYLRLCPDSMAFSDIMTLIFINEKNLVKEFPITVEARKGGKSTINILTAIDTVAEILNISVLFNPGRIFYPISFACITFGILWAIPFLLLGRGVSIAAMLAIVTGLLFFAIGLIAQQLSAIRRDFLNRHDAKHEMKD